MNSIIKLKNRPKGTPTLANFEFAETEMPSAKAGEILLKTHYVSVDPYLRGRMRDADSYIEPFQVGKPVESGIIAEVVESNHEGYQKGDFVQGMLQWAKYQTSNGEELNKVDPNRAPLSAYLGLLGLTGLTAYLSLKQIADLQPGETLLVSGASGAVGSTVGQIGKIKGCHVVGIAGSDEKLALMREKFGFDEGINYKTTENIKKALAEACPKGVDVYFDNVGGEILDAAMPMMNKNGRIINCGAISLYNETQMPTGPRHEGLMVQKTLLMQGFLVRNYEEEYPAAIKQLATWLQEGKLTYEETVVEGFEHIPQAFLDLFEGKNKGKMVVKV